jgi:hypothetical protein
LATGGWPLGQAIDQDIVFGALLLGEDHRTLQA